MKILNKNWSTQELELLSGCDLAGELDSHSDFLIKEFDRVYIHYSDKKKKSFEIDLLNPTFLHRLKTLKKSDSLFKALQLTKDSIVLDATAGLGKDLLGIAKFSKKVDACESNPIIYLLLKNALQRGLTQLHKWIPGDIDLLYMNALDLMKEKKMYYDAIYIDTMYPHSQSSALPKKDILVLREIVKSADQTEELLETAIGSSKSRVILKRPHGAPVLLRPHHSFESKMVRYDLYKKN